jgi:XTP/dITP diphosphohydrolase
MTTILFASNNLHKIDEIRSALASVVNIISLKDAGISIEIPEPHQTLEENAREKSTRIYALTGTSCFSEDTGLEVHALDNQPGVLSARYAGEGKSSEANIVKLLDKLKGRNDRRARFRTVISLIWKGKEQQFEGICDGLIAEHARGTQGFGYDPVFIPAGSTMTFAEMTLEEKNSYSHRKKAADQLVLFLQQEQ